MKLIIDISKEDYAETMYRKQHTPRDMDWADKIIANGVMLDDVKAEIELFSDAKHTDQLWKEDIFEIIDEYIGGKE